MCVFYVSDMHMYKYPLVGKFGLIKTVAGKERRRNQHPRAMSSINIWDLARNFSNNNKMGGKETFTLSVEPVHRMDVTCSSYRAWEENSAGVSSVPPQV